MKTVKVISGIAIVAIFLTAGLSMSLVADAYVLTTGEMEYFVGGDDCGSCKTSSNGEYCWRCIKTDTNKSKKYPDATGSAYKCIDSDDPNDECDMTGTMNCGTDLKVRFWDGNENCNGTHDREETGQSHSIDDASGDFCNKDQISAFDFQFSPQPGDFKPPGWGNPGHIFGKFLTVSWLKAQSVRSCS